MCVCAYTCMYILGNVSRKVQSKTRGMKGSDLREERSKEKRGPQRACDMKSQDGLFKC